MATDRRQGFERDGFVVLPGYVPAVELAPGVAELPVLFPTAGEFHNDVDPVRNDRFRDEFGGIIRFPFDATELSLLSVHPTLIELAEEFLETHDIRVYSIEAWAKYTGAASYEQSHHRDYLNHSLLVPTRQDPPMQVEMFLYLSDVSSTLGPPSYVPLEHTSSAAALPNWLPPHNASADDEHPDWVSSQAWPWLYEREVRAVGGAGTVVAYRLETFHRGTNLTEPRGARYTIHVNFRRADADWIGRRAWTEVANTAPWQSFVSRASARQLRVFGFPPPGHPYWTDDTLAGIEMRYPGFDPVPWRAG